MPLLPRRPRADHTRIAAQLRARPGEWATVNTYPSRPSADGIARKIRRAQGQLHMYAPAGAFETRMRAVDDGTLLEARYTTPTPAAPPVGCPPRRTSDARTRRLNGAS